MAASEVEQPLITPDGRYIVVRGRLWRRSNPALDAAARQSLVDALMASRRAVRAALRAGDRDALLDARARVHAAKVALGERGPVSWTDSAPDENRRMAAHSSYAKWYAARAAELISATENHARQVASGDPPPALNHRR